MSSALLSSFWVWKLLQVPGSQNSKQKQWQNTCCTGQTCFGTASSVSPNQKIPPKTMNHAGSQENAFWPTHCTGGRSWRPRCASAKRTAPKARVGGAKRRHGVQKLERPRSRPRSSSIFLKENLGRTNPKHFCLIFVKARIGNKIKSREAFYLDRTIRADLACF